MTLYQFLVWVPTTLFTVVANVLNSCQIADGLTLWHMTIVFLILGILVTAIIKTAKV